MNYHTARVCHIYFTLYFFCMNWNLLHTILFSVHLEGPWGLCLNLIIFCILLLGACVHLSWKCSFPLRQMSKLIYFLKVALLLAHADHEWTHTNEQTKMLANRVVRTFVSLLVQTVVTAFMFWCEESFAVVKLGNLCSKWLCSKWKMADQIKLLCLLSEVSFPQECLACWVVSGCLVA